MKRTYTFVLLFCLPILMFGQTISGDLMRWHKLTIDFDGPNTSETANTNPFADYLLEVTFTHNNSGEEYVIQGFYAGCDNAEDSNCTSGNVWRAHFAPGQTGNWSWEASFRSGDDVAINGGGSNGGFMNGDTGSFSIAESNKSGRDFRASNRGRLQYVGEHYLRFSGTNPQNPNGAWFVKGGPDSPENAFAYEDFDDTPNRENRRKSWQPHQQDYDASDAAEFTWDGGKGTELLGVINYIHNEGANAMSFLTFSLGGDDENVFPHLIRVSEDEYNGFNDNQQWNNGVHQDRFDVSKMAQWEKIMEYADLKGVYLHFKTFETENDQYMDGGELGRERKLYYRELVARFGHHLGLNWNLSEESSLDSDVIIDNIDYLNDIDAYHHNTVLHTYPNDKEGRYNPLLGNNSLMTGASLQSSINAVHNDVITWTRNSRNANRKWVVANDEQGPAGTGVRVDDDRLREDVLYGTLMAGGAGVEYYYGGNITGDGDHNNQDHRLRGNKYKEAGYAITFFENYFNEYLIGAVSDDNLTSDSDDFVLANSGEAYAIYLPDGGSTGLSLPTGNSNYDVQWYNPRTGGNLTAPASLGSTLTAPDSNDWVALITVSGTVVVDAIDLPGFFEAEDFTAQSGIQTETTQDTGGGLNIGFIEEGDSVEYLVDVASAGTYEIDFRIASDTNGGDMVIESNGTQIGEVTVPGTGGWQNWQNLTTTVDLAAGEQTLKLNFEGGVDRYFFNINTISVEEFDGDDDDDDTDIGDECEEYEEENGLVIIEAENTSSNLDEWILKTDVDDYKGSGHLEFTGNSTSNGPPSSPLTYTFKINQGGLYQLTLRCRKRITPPDESDKSNDSYVRVEGDYDASSDAGNSHLDDAPKSALETDTKLFGGNENSWGWAERLDLGGEVNKRIPKYEFKAGETYTIVMSGRSKQFNVDRIIFYRLEDYTTTQARNAQDNLGESTCNDDDTDNVSPEVTLLTPSNTAIEVGEPITFEALADDADGSISNVRFYANEELLFTENFAPYERSYTFDEPGTYEIEAIATDNDNNTTTSNTVVITVSNDDETTVVGQTMILSPIQDAYLQGNSRFNSEIVRVENGNRTGFLMFDLSSVETPILNASLEFTISSDPGNGTLNVYKGSSNDWTENNISIANKPQEGEVLGSVNGSFALNSVVTIPLSVEDISSGEALSLVLALSAASNDIAFASKESKTVAAPRLIINGNDNKDNPDSSLIDISMFPNPAKDVLNFSEVPEGTRVRIVNMLGAVQADVLIDSGQTSVDVSSLASGLYLVNFSEVQNDFKDFGTYKLVIE